MDDYFRIQRITELALSSSGDRLAYIVESPVLDENRTARAAYIGGLEKNSNPRKIEGLARAHGLAWVPGADRIAYIAVEKGVSNVYVFDEQAGGTVQATQGADPVVQFRWSPDGVGLAYETEARTDPSTSIYQRFRDGTGGILIDPDTLGAHDLINPNWAKTNPLRPMARRIWIKGAVAGAADIPVTIPGDVSEFFWSSDSTQLSVTYVADDLPASASRPSHTSVGIVDARTGHFTPLLTGRPPVGKEPGVWYSGGEWIPGEAKILARRYTQDDPMVSMEFPEWTVIFAAAAGSPSWNPAETYHARYFPQSASVLLVENTVRAQSGLFRWTPQGIESSDISSGLDGSSSLFALGPKPGSAVFVNESLTRPPEIFVRSGDGKPAWQLTSLNPHLATGAFVKASEVTWKSADGKNVSGWLLVPAGQHGPWPMVTMVHGGPTFPFPDAFAPYFYYWPFPFDAYVAHGIAVFVPNYRGTSTFGRKYQAPDDGARVPVEDIISGVKKLIADGVGDPARLGISGQSHGAWLGPLALTRLPIFKASSFAEGTADMAANYELLDGLANRELRDIEFGYSLYDAPQRYIELSPDLNFSKVRSANLYEAGAYSQALEMLSFAKVSRHFGLPTEFVIYPKTAHNPNLPAIQRESADRNLDWFLYWLKGERDPDPAKAEQYARWNKLRVSQK